MSQSTRHIPPRLRDFTQLISPNIRKSPSFSARQFQKGAQMVYDQYRAEPLQGGLGDIRKISGTLAPQFNLSGNEGEVLALASAAALGLLDRALDGSPATWALESLAGDHARARLIELAWELKKHSRSEIILVLRALGSEGRARLRAISGTQRGGRIPGSSAQHPWSGQHPWPLSGWPNGWVAALDPAGMTAELGRSDLFTSALERWVTRAHYERLGTEPGPERPIRRPDEWNQESSIPVLVDACADALGLRLEGRTLQTPAGRLRARPDAETFRSSAADFLWDAPPEDAYEVLYPWFSELRWDLEGAGRRVSAWSWLSVLPVAVIVRSLGADIKVQDNTMPCGPTDQIAAAIWNALQVPADERRRRGLLMLALVTMYDQPEEK